MSRPHRIDVHHHPSPPNRRLVFGTDFPYRTAAETVGGLSRCGFSPAELRAIDCENAQRLMPRWNK